MKTFEKQNLWSLLSGGPCHLYVIKIETETQNGGCCGQTVIIWKWPLIQVWLVVLEKQILLYTKQIKNIFCSFIFQNYLKKISSNFFKVRLKINSFCQKGLVKLNCSKIARWMFLSWGSISPMLYEHLLCAQIPKAIKTLMTWLSFALLGSLHVKLNVNMLVKLTLGLKIYSNNVKL